MTRKKLTDAEILAEAQALDKAYAEAEAFDRAQAPTKRVWKVYWDNGAAGSGGEKFGLFDRRANTVLYPDLMAALQRASTSSYALADVPPPASK